MKASLPLLALALCLACSAPKKDPLRENIAAAMEKSLRTETLDKWYPLAIDSQYGGFLSTFTFDFKPTGDQDKMIVTQARHVWTNARASERYPDVAQYKENAHHGFLFLRDVMWDKTYGGFHTLVDRAGAVKATGHEEKTAYGNSFGLYALSAYYHASHDTAALNLAKKCFAWLEAHSHDPNQKGYFQHLKRDGTVIVRDTTVASTAETGYKDQNSSIHLLEALTELYSVWPDPLVHERLQEMLVLIRDTIVHPKGYLQLFFLPDWTPVSFRDSSEASIQKHHGLDHVSFGHDIETAYLMLEASHMAGNENDTTTLRIAKKMVDHAIDNGLDSTGGFYDEAYYFKDRPGITITRDTKNWWAQAEGMNTLLLMADRFPDDPHHYFEKFKTQWTYIDTNLIDHVNGDWFEAGIDKQPEKKTALKGHIWKATYHHYRAMANCMDELRKR
ncbi:AGE family epimerase/isomerase [Chryseolinea lacunae]|uniref:AGE family epimerase/isomerase n=1 Tax=Chryseolinea lacunae TaxID=2801331 RepID=A0ABS1KYG1_9BACT|nr:AGE family epimerase/isomerase [Chryseolinea lacunae]MBL0744483.1 AGE family epimerase/isomerase [Chryseolinea lacunae]